MLNELLKINQEDIISKYINDLSKSSKKIIVWGATSCNNYLSFLQSKQLLNRVIFLADNNSSLRGEFVNGIEILNCDDVFEILVQDSDVNVVITSIHAFEIKKQLLDLGIKKASIDILGVAIAYEYKNENQKVLNVNIDKFSHVYNTLSDDVSKNIYFNILKSKLSFDNELLCNVSSKSQDQYFEKDLIEITENDVFCDCGSFTGDTLDIFISKYKKYKKYIAIEADPINYKKLRENIKEKKYENIIAKNVGCWDEENTLFFSSNSIAGKIENTGDLEIKVDKLDHILKDEEITFLKMDIEGAEEKALLGAENIIKRDSPVLAICLYHSMEDFYKLPLLIKKMNPDYHLFVRHYTPMFNTETVCYAIPTKKLIK